MTNTEMRIGIDLGGTKIEALAIDNQGVELARYRIDTPRDDYRATLAAMVELVHRLEKETGRTGTVGAGIPGSISRITGLVKNSNSTWLNQPSVKVVLQHYGGRCSMSNKSCILLPTIAPWRWPTRKPCSASTTTVCTTWSNWLHDTIRPQSALQSIPHSLGYAVTRATPLS